MRFEQCSDDPGKVTIYFEPTPAAPPEPLSLEAATGYTIAAMCGGPVDDLKRAFEVIGEDSGSAYRQVLQAATLGERPADAFREALHLDWTVRGFRHRAEVQDDDLLVRAFRRVFAPYDGPRLVLYRGERASEIEAGRLGLNWSPSQEVARMFASGLCATYGSHGVLLTAIAEGAAIITGPNDHSANWLREFEHVVDPRMLTDVKEIARFPPHVAARS